MRTLYEAGNAVEAHMLMHLLQQEGYSPQVLGEYLQGGIGEIPPHGLVRLCIPDEEYAGARTFLDQWEKSQPAAASVPEPQSDGTGKFLTGLAIGIALAYAYFQAPISRDGVDYNYDGVFDEKWVYSPSGRATQYEADRNLDGKADFIIKYDRHGRSHTGESDDNFDGIFESHMRYHEGNIETIASDTDGDGYADLRISNNRGVLEMVEYINPYSGLPLRVETYHLGKLTHAEVDTNTDGKLDTQLKYSPLAEVVSREAIPQQRQTGGKQ